MSQWKTYKDENKQNGGGGLFLRLKDGEGVTGIISGDPLRRIVHWVDNKPWLCAGVGCAECSSGDRPRKSFAFLLFNIGTGSWCVMELSPTAFDEVAELEEDFASRVIGIKRTGAGLRDTRYRARSGDRISDELKQRMRGSEKPDLRKLCVEDLDVCEKVSSPGTATQDDFNDRF